MNNFLNNNYKNFINKFLENGYRVVTFDDFDSNKSQQLILRHDIDFDLSIAYEIAKIEHELNISSTFFFLLRGDFYNLLSEKNYHLVNEIKRLGHIVSLHYDIEIYKEPKKELVNEIKIFENLFETKINIISIHRPNKEFLNSPDNYFYIENTYESKFTKNIAYFADSGGRFRYGNPVESGDYNSKNNIQLLTHPVWWVSNLQSVNEILEELIDLRNADLVSLFKKNVKTFHSID